MRYGLIGFFALLWMAAAVLTGAVTQDDPSVAGGSSQSFEDFVGNTYEAQETQIDRPVTGGNTPISAALSYATAAVNWVTYLWNSASLSGPLWEGWAAPIRYTILVLQLPFLLLLLFEGAKILGGFIPFT